MLLTAKELATALDVHITTIRRAYRSKRIPYERLCKLYFFDLEKVRSAMRRDGLDLTALRVRIIMSLRPFMGSRSHRTWSETVRAIRSRCADQRWHLVGSQTGCALGLTQQGQLMAGMW